MSRWYQRWLPRLQRVDGWCPVPLAVRAALTALHAGAVVGVLPLRGRWHLVAGGTDGLFHEVIGRPATADHLKRCLAVWRWKHGLPTDRVLWLGEDPPPACCLLPDPPADLTVQPWTGEWTLHLGAAYAVAANAARPVVVAQGAGWRRWTRITRIARWVLVGGCLLVAACASHHQHNDRQQANRARRTAQDWATAAHRAPPAHAASAELARAVGELRGWQQAGVAHEAARAALAAWQATIPRPLAYTHEQLAYRYEPRAAHGNGPQLRFQGTITGFGAPLDNAALLEQLGQWLSGSGGQSSLADLRWEPHLPGIQSIKGVWHHAP
jgi:hypothetical protein